MTESESGMDHACTEPQSLHRGSARLQGLRLLETWRLLCARNDTKLSVRSRAWCFFHRMSIILYELFNAWCIKTIPSSWILCSAHLHAAIFAFISLSKKPKLKVLHTLRLHQLAGSIYFPKTWQLWWASLHSSQYYVTFPPPYCTLLLLLLSNGNVL